VTGSGWNVLLLDCWERAALAACRTLGRSGHRVGVAAAPEALLAARSRFAACVHRLPDPHRQAEPFRVGLDAIIRAHAYDVVVAVHDGTLARLGSLGPLAVPCAPSVDRGHARLTDKFGLAAIARDAGVPYPATFRPDRGENIAELVASGCLALPFVVKSERSATAEPELVRVARGATVATDVAAGMRAFDALRREGVTPLLQRRVEGAMKLNAALIRRGGRTEFRYAHRVLRECPPAGGTGVTLETIPPDRGLGATAVRLLERVCDAAGYEGLAQAELYVERGSGSTYLIEVNPRLWGSTWFAERLGQRVVERLIRHALGLASPPQDPYPVGRRFHHLSGELNWLRQRGRPARDLLELAATTRPWDVFDGLDPADSYPVLHHALARRRKSARRDGPPAGEDHVLGAGGAQGAGSAVGAPLEDLVQPDAGVLRQARHAEERERPEAVAGTTQDL
jgi:hypothetical protein